MFQTKKNLFFLIYFIFFNNKNILCLNLNIHFKTIKTSAHKTTPHNHQAYEGSKSELPEVILCILKSSRRGVRRDLLGNIMVCIKFIYLQ